MVIIDFRNALRSLLKNRKTTSIHIFGLSLGITCFIFVFLYIFTELSYDKYNVNAKRLYRIVTKYAHGNDDYYSTRTPAPLAEALKSEFPSVEGVTRLRVIGHSIVQVNNQNFREDLILGADPNISELFTFSSVKGDLSKGLAEPNTAIITKSTADKYFGSDNTIGKQLKINNGSSDYWFTVTCVINDIPKNSHFHFQVLVSNNTFQESKGPWNSGFGITYFLLKGNARIKDIEKSLGSFIAKYKSKEEIEDFNMSYKIQRLTDIHLFSHCRKELETNGNLLSLYIFSTLAILILIVTCINYIVLSTAKSEDKAKEIGLRKTFGASRWSHGRSILFESLILCCIAFVTSLILVILLFNFFKTNLYDLDLGILLKVIPVLFGFVLLLGVLAGLYPAYYFASSKLDTLIKKEHKLGFNRINGRTALIVVQVAICIDLIIFNITIFKQHQFIQEITEKSFAKDNIVVVNNILLLKGAAYDLKNDLAKYPGITDATLCSQLPCVGEIPETTCALKENRKFINTKILACDYDYLSTLGIKTPIEGRFFSQSFPSDSNAIIINEKAVKELELSHPINKILRVNGRDKTVIGVIKDFNYEPVFGEIQPLGIIFSGTSFRARYLALKVNQNNDLKDILKFTKSKWESYTKDIPFEYSFFNDDYLKTYQAVNRTKKLAFIFLILIIAISGLGLISLIAFISEKRTKEIGIRKVNGAKVDEIMAMLNKDFIKWGAIAFIIACPIAWYAMHKWLQNFAFKTNLSWWVFAAAGGIALVIALLTVSWQSWRAATKNPVEALRYE